MRGSTNAFAQMIFAPAALAEDEEQSAMSDFGKSRLAVHSSSRARGESRAHGASKQVLM
jgi:hypothetical protein